MVPELADTGHCLVHGVVAKAPFAQRPMRQDRSRVATLDDQDRERRVAAVFGGGAIIHRSVGHR
eukprot:7365630-Alexandrium_andersonii.AAC.1